MNSVNNFSTWSDAHFVFNVVQVDIFRCPSCLYISCENCIKKRNQHLRKQHTFSYPWLVLIQHVPLTKARIQMQISCYMNMIFNEWLHLARYVRRKCFIKHRVSFHTWISIMNTYSMLMVIELIVINLMPFLKWNLDIMKICHTSFQYLKCCTSEDNLIIKVFLPIAFHSFFYLEQFPELNVAILWCLFLLHRHK